MGNARVVPLNKVQFNDSIWARRANIVREVVVPYQWDILNDRVPNVPPSHAIENFRIAAGEAEGEFAGRIFQDSDVAKWLEAVSYILASKPDEELEKTADDVIDLVVRAQREDGYLNTYFTIAEPDKRWTNVRDLHEMYCAGHMMEAAVAYYEATGKRKLLDAMCRMADHIASVFGRGEGQKRGYPGHSEIELALVKLYRATGDRRYLDLSSYFIEERGRQPHWYEIEAEARGEDPGNRRRNLSYSQAHLPIREQTTAEGHSVRAFYLLSGVIDVAAETEDGELLDVCRTIWNNATQRRMYVTGGVGSAVAGERFTFDYDLPNDRAYAETCANIALVFAAHRMLQVDVDGRYGDTMERALYNGVLSGISLDGTKFFYVNPLTVWPEACEKRNDMRHVQATRQGWFDCACCPPNIARLIASLGQYSYSQSSDTAYIHLYAAGEAHLEIGKTPVKLVQETDYPWDEKVELTLHLEQASEFTLALRIPDWSRAPQIKVNGEALSVGSMTEKGYAYIKRSWQDGDQVKLTLPMPVERIEAHPQVRENAGRVAIQRGPIVYCIEEVDNGPNLSAIILPREANLTARWESALLGGVVVVTGEASRVDESSWRENLYRPTGEIKSQTTQIKAVPYATWCNRDPGEMLVWIRTC